jgi:hypothetical protein
MPALCTYPASNVWRKQSVQPSDVEIYLLTRQIDGLGTKVGSHKRPTLNVRRAHCPHIASDVVRPPRHSISLQFSLRATLGLMRARCAPQPAFPRGHSHHMSRGPPRADIARRTRRYVFCARAPPARRVVGSLHARRARSRVRGWRGLSAGCGQPLDCDEGGAPCRAPWRALC